MPRRGAWVIFWGSFLLGALGAVGVRTWAADVAGEPPWVVGACKGRVGSEESLEGLSEEGLPGLLVQPGGRLIGQIHRYIRPLVISEKQPPRRRPGYVKPGYAIDVHLPVLEGLGDPQSRQAFRDVVVRRAEEIIKSYKSSFQDVEERPESDEERKELEKEGLLQDSPGSYLEIGYAVTYLDDSWVSVLFCVEDYGVGAAHPNAWAYTVNFSLREGRVLQLGDLFRSNHRWHDPARFTREWVRDCATQILEFRDYFQEEELESIIRDLLTDMYGKPIRAWEDFLLTRRGLMIVSSSFPHVVGEVQVCEISYERLKGALRPEFEALLGQKPEGGRPSRTPGRTSSPVDR